MKIGYVLLAGTLLFMISIPTQVSGSKGCELSIAAEPPVVNFPFRNLPQGSAATIGEVFKVSYSSLLTNQTVIIQVLNGTQWTNLQSFTGNTEGFTEIGIGLQSRWAVYGQNSIRAVSGLCTSETASFAVQYDVNAVLLDFVVYTSVILVFVAFVWIGLKFSWKLFPLAALGVYLILAPWTGQRYDVYFLLSSGIRILQHVNPFDPGNPAVFPSPLKWAYPPAYPFYSAASFLLFQVLTGSPIPPVGALTYPGWLTSTYSIFEAYVPPTLPVLVLLLKLPIVASAISIGILLKKMTGKSFAAVWWLVNPLVILISAVWGELDPIATFFSIAALYSFETKREYRAYFLASIGAAVKVWPSLLIPLFLVVSFRRNGLKAFKPLVAVVPTLAATLTAYAAFGNPLESLFLFTYARGIPTFAGAFSVNGLTWQEVLFVLGSPPLPVFLFLGIPLYAVILAWAYWKKETDVTKLVVLLLLVFYLTYNYVNPQYFLWILPFLILRGKRLATLVLTAMPLVYVALSYNIFYFVSPAILPDELVLGPSVFEQLKVSFFYQTPALFLIVTALVPTIAYVLLFRDEIMHPPRVSVGWKPRPGEQGFPRAKTWLLRLHSPLWQILKHRWETTRTRLVSLNHEKET